MRTSAQRKHRSPKRVDIGTSKDVSWRRRVVETSCVAGTVVYYSRIVKVVLFSVASVYVCLFVCQRDNSWTVWDIIMRFSWEHGQKLGRIRKWRHSDALQHAGDNLASLMSPSFSSRKDWDRDVATLVYWFIPLRSDDVPEFYSDPATFPEILGIYELLIYNKKLS